MGYETGQSEWSAGAHARYRVDIVKNGVRWVDADGITATADDIAATAIALVTEAALETSPQAGAVCAAEVFDEQGVCILKAELSLVSPIADGSASPGADAPTEVRARGRR